MQLLEKIYAYLLKATSKSGEQGEYSGGHWQAAVRAAALDISASTSGRLLEVGCGEALFLAELALANRSLELHGVDNWEQILERAKERLAGKEIGTVKLSLADGAKLPFADSYFETVVCINTIFNLDSLVTVNKVFREISRVCKKGGKVIIDYRNANNPLLYFKYKLAPYYDRTVKDLPLRTYRLAELKPLLEAAGLKITRQMHIGFPPVGIAPIIVLEIEKI
jgi:ubiquinone/menaquinone biosynthesis C-methylase UbiE